jgi:hypothetical protein
VFISEEKRLAIEGSAEKQIIPRPVHDHCRQEDSAVVADGKVAETFLPAWRRVRAAVQENFRLGVRFGLFFIERLSHVCHKDLAKGALGRRAALGADWRVI